MCNDFSALFHYRHPFEWWLGAAEFILIEPFIVCTEIQKKMCPLKQKKFKIHYLPPPTWNIKNYSIQFKEVKKKTFNWLDKSQK